MVIPPFLKPGDRIRIVSPAGKIDEKPMTLPLDWLKQQGFRIELGKNAFAGHFQYAGTDRERLEDLQDALDEPGLGAIFCSRGGYGTIRLVENLDFSGFLKHPKWLTGFSDITVLHCALNKLGIASVHGVMPRLYFSDSGEKSENIESLMDLLSGNKAGYSIESHPLNRQGTAKGELVGGNLSLICSLQGTPLELNSKGRILFLEDTGEYLYHIDRMMYNLKLSGKLKDLKGLVTGEFTDAKDNPEPFGSDVYEIIYESVKEYSYPVCFGFPAGHGMRNLALAFGVKWEIIVGQDDCGLKMI